MGASDRARFEALARALPHLRETLRLVPYSEVEHLCEELAAQLIAGIGRDELRRCRFQAIPRGGLIVLGMLSYLLGVEHRQLLPGRGPLVLVDDCALSGVRCVQALAQHQAPEVIVAPLLSHPALREALVAREARVQGCFSGGDLSDSLPARFPDPAERAAWEARWRAIAPPEVVWVGLPEHVIFPWSEPDYLFWNAEREAAEVGWYLAPPDRCLKNRMRLIGSLGDSALGPTRGPWRPAAAVVHGDFDEALLLTNLLSEAYVVLQNVAADCWRALIATGDIDASVALVAELYEVEPARLAADVAPLMAQWQAEGWLVREEREQAAHDRDLSALWPHAGDRFPAPRPGPGGERPPG